ncbi:hypothetical protein [Streptomyces cyaneofuscatus]|uniref:hypothetical protein n=1 Tax=Streptomyces cyaneofuscatus TaxID=66883 RepID=UPI0037915171
MTTAQWCRAAARRISRGSSRLATLAGQRAARTGGRRWSAITGWVGAASGLAWVLRVAALILAALVLRKVAFSVAAGLTARADSARWLLWPLAIAWIIAAYRTGHPDWTPNEQPEQPADSDEPATQETDEDTQPGSAPEAFLPHLQDLREAVWKVGTPHAHITALAADLNTTPDRVRESLTKWGIPVEPVRMRGRGSSTGVKGDHFPAPATPPGGVVAAGQPANNNDNNATVQYHAGGAHITVTPPRQDTAAA